MRVPTRSCGCRRKLAGPLANNLDRLGPYQYTEKPPPFGETSGLTPYLTLANLDEDGGAHALLQREKDESKGKRTS